METKIIKKDSDICACPNALRVMGTIFDIAEICYRCGKTIDVSTWHDWRSAHPTTPETNFFAFALKRDDAGELADKPNHYFLTEICDLWEALTSKPVTRKFVKTREEFAEWQNRHVVSRHISYEEFLEQRGFEPKNGD